MAQSTRHLALFNLGRMRYPLGDPRMAEFVNNFRRIVRIAEQTKGFVWRLQDESGYLSAVLYDDPRILANLTLWEHVEGLERFVWKTAHGRFYVRREEWFEKMEMPLAMWWVPAGYRPSLDEAVERLDHLRAHGSSDFAFGWEGLPEAQLWKKMHAAGSRKFTLHWNTFPGARLWKRMRSGWPRENRA
jgi:hypothetical protein